MSNEESVFKALASPVRREILFHLRQGELSAGDIASKFDIAAPTI
ncbi:MAG: helix-turn-helix domain-containing protein, partial [Acidimicrobiia bacterium]